MRYFGQKFKIVQIFNTNLAALKVTVMAQRGTDVWRDSGKQQQYRSQSASNDPSKQVGHKLSLEVAMQISGGQKIDDGKMKAVLNSHDNFRMISKEGNERQHELDQKLMEKSKAHQRPNAAEDQRAQQQIEFIRNKRDQFDPNFVSAASTFYGNMGYKL